MAVNDGGKPNVVASLVDFDRDAVPNRCLWHDQYVATVDLCDTITLVTGTLNVDRTAFSRRHRRTVVRFSVGTGWVLCLSRVGLVGWGGEECDSVRIAERTFGEDGEWQIHSGSDIVEIVRAFTAGSEDGEIE